MVGVSATAEVSSPPAVTWQARRPVIVLKILPPLSIVTAALFRAVVGASILVNVLLVAGCVSSRAASTRSAGATSTSVAERAVIPSDQDVDHVETVIKSVSATEPVQGARESFSTENEATTLTLPDAIAFALQNSPRLRSAGAAINRARGGEQVAFAPFLPQVALWGQTGAVSAAMGPGVVGYAGFLTPSTYGTRTYEQANVALEWTIYNFGRNSGRYHQSIAQEHIARFRCVRAKQTVAFDVTVAYLDILLARASRRAQEEAIRRAEAILANIEVEREAGVVLRADLLRAEVILSESREALVLAKEAEYDAMARLNNAMGRNAGLPLDVVDLEPLSELPGELSNYLDMAASTRPEVSLAQQVVVAAQEGRGVARAEFMPRVFVRSTVGYGEGSNILNGSLDGAGLHVEMPLYTGGALRGGLTVANAEFENALADAQDILNLVSLQVSLAYRNFVASYQRISLSQTAVVQSTEYLRLIEIRYRNGDATPADIVDGQATLTRSQQRYFSANYTYHAALAGLDYALGRPQGASLTGESDILSEPPPPPE
jgi:outer membrane protein TolC